MIGAGVIEQERRISITRKSLFAIVVRLFEMVVRLARRADADDSSRRSGNLLSKRARNSAPGLSRRGRRYPMSVFIGGVEFREAFKFRRNLNRNRVIG
jgi:hypothetical protein